MVQYFKIIARNPLCWGFVLFLSCGTGHAKGFSVLHDFCSQRYCTDGEYPTAALIADKKGNLYSTTFGGGHDDGNCMQQALIGCGTVFKITPDGKETVLYAFLGGADGQYPYAGLVMDGKGNLYGTTTAGGNQGTVFRIAPDGTETILHAFTGGSDGGTPEAGLILDDSGNLYGTTRWGGVGRTWGTVFKLAPDGTETVLYSFCAPSACNDGSDPEGGLVADASGNFFGTTKRGGANDGGVVFKLAPNGTETKLYDFCSQTVCADGGGPLADLVVDKKANLYGTTHGGGTYDEGTVFKLATDGTETVLHSFTGGTDGGGPYGGVIFDTKGNLYGTAALGGAYGFGNVFKLSPGGTETVLYSFTHGKDGSQPNAAPLLDGHGNLYGTADYGAKTSCHNKQGCGTVFRLKD